MLDATERWLEAVRNNSSLRQASTAVLARRINFYDRIAATIVKQRRDAKDLLETLERADKTNKVA